MRFRSFLAGGAMFLLLLAAHASGQTSQIGKTWELGHSLADKLEPFVWPVERAGRFEYGADYVQRVEDRIAAVAGAKPHEIRVTWGHEWYGFVLPGEAQYLSVGLLGRVSSEAELAGLLAHQLAHVQHSAATANQSLIFEQCILATGYLPVPRSPRESEKRATTRATGYLKAAGYDPSAQLDLLSRVAYEHQPWSKGIVAEDLLGLRVALEAEPEPAGGYAIDTSEFAEFQAKLLHPSEQSPTISLRPR